VRSIVFAYQDIGYVCLQALLEMNADIALVLTHEDDPHEEIWFRSVARLAERHGLPLITPENPNLPEIVGRVSGLRPDFIFSFYYRHMLAEPLLKAAAVGAYNLHGSLLPKYRGRAPINWVLVNGERETGVTLHRMVKRPDAGPIVSQIPVHIAHTDNVRDLYAKMTAAASELIKQTYPDMITGRFTETEQNENQATYFGGRRPEDGRIDWSGSAGKAYDLVRAVTHPYPGAFAFHNDRKLFIWQADFRPDHPDLPALDPTPGRIIGLDSKQGLAVILTIGVLFIKSAQWEGHNEQHAADLGLTAGDRLE
jgi:methionyl-tRNA formyltransferase